MYFECGGSESIEDWQERGTYYHFPWPRDGSSTDNRVRVHTAFTPGTDMTNTRILLFDHSHQVAQIKIKDGRVESVTMHDM